MPQITVTINGRSFRMACDEGEEERLTALATRFDGTIETLRGSFGEIGDLRLTVMAGIMVTDELAEMERRLKALEGEMQSLRDSGSSIAEDAERDRQQLAEGLEEAAKRIEQLAESLTRSMRPADT
ncbi:cell division protein ZapA [Stappia sp. F7233]|uniref:Cell division protein ZapA n=1 Tax=Stappia albiluteola TaxID=2758565 RepID=A0A839AE89_9HYPH|nr:cell division protein ZapA [Stappia albiluteola]MBA5777274.1 cell division protein ZapA [Stappia albiluteola]